MEINNITLFFVGITIAILGSLIMIFDFPQIQYFESMESESYLMLEGEDKDIHQRLKIEFAIGSSLLGVGIIFLLLSVFKKSKDRKF